MLILAPKLELTSLLIFFIFTFSAILIEDYKVENGLGDINLIVVDGTWKEAKGIYFNFPKLHNLKKVRFVYYYKPILNCCNPLTYQKT